MTSATFEPTCFHLFEITTFAHYNEHERSTKKDQSYREQWNFG